LNLCRKENICEEGIEESDVEKNIYCQLDNVKHCGSLCLDLEVDESKNSYDLLSDFLATSFHRVVSVIIALSEILNERVLKEKIDSHFEKVPLMFLDQLRFVCD
jgi:hypothetical protein